MTKVTKKQNFEAIVAILEDGGYADLANVMRHEIELVEKKNSYKSTKPTATQIEGERIKGVILGALADGKAYTVTEIQKSNADLGAFSNQRVSALINQLVDDGKVVKTIDKRKSYFSLA